MCGRIALHEPTARLARLFDAVPGADVEQVWHASYNVPPTTRIPVVVARRVPPATAGDTQDGDGAAAGPVVVRRLVLLRWGLVPPWAKDPSVGNRMINARSETVATRPAFRTALRRHRAIVPADGFFEWQPAPGRGPRRPWYFTRADGQPLALAGLWEAWRDPEAPPDAPPLRTCTIITTPSSDDVAAVHDRMPVVLEPAAWERWLDPDLDEADAVADLLAAPPAGTLHAVPVRRDVSSVANDGPELIEPVEEPTPAEAAGATAATHG